MGDIVVEIEVYPKNQYEINKILFIKIKISHSLTLVPEVLTPTMQYVEFLKAVKYSLKYTDNKDQIYALHRSLLQATRMIGKLKLYYLWKKETKIMKSKNKN